MRTIRAAETQPCHVCRFPAETGVARGHRLWYACWEHANTLLEDGGVLVVADLRWDTR